MYYQNMTEPLIWEKYGEYIISDIGISLQDKVKEFIIHHYIKKNVFMGMINYTDEENYIGNHDSYLDHIFRDQSSVVFLNEKTQEIVAAAIVKTMTREMKSWTAIRLISESEKLNILLTITRRLISEASDVLDNFSGSLHIFELCALNDEAENDWIQIMFYGACRVAQAMQMPLVTFIGFTQAEHKAAVLAGLTELNRMFYPSFTDVDGNHPISPSLTGELYAVLFYKEIEPFVPHDQLP